MKLKKKPMKFHLLKITRAQFYKYIISGHSRAQTPFLSAKTPAVVGQLVGLTFMGEILNFLPKLGISEDMI